MRLAHVGPQVALIIGALALSAPAAMAASSEPAIGKSTADVELSPRKASPGRTVTVTTSACGKETYGKGESEAGGKFHLLAGDRKGVLVGTFKVPENATSGTDTVTLKCPPRIKQTVTYQIVDRPKGGIDAGRGWAAGAGQLDDPGSRLALGGLLLGGAVAGGVTTWRRRSTDTRTAA
ncbi:MULTISPECIES: sortase [unclassified Streptomyces]|uniref:sortase n=1 Tax=unclassified Streptomyces TaxID=2593676 RepID=UPI0034438390